jgi:hypothetical protein
VRSHRFLHHMSQPPKPLALAITVMTRVIVRFPIPFLHKPTACEVDLLISIQDDSPTAANGLCVSLQLRPMR